MYKQKTTYSTNASGRTDERSNYNTRVKRIEDRDKSGLLMKLEWPEESIFDDGKQNNTLTGAAHPGCCKQ